MWEAQANWLRGDYLSASLFVLIYAVFINISNSQVQYFDAESENYVYSYEYLSYYYMTLDRKCVCVCPSL